VIDHPCMGCGLSEAKARYYKIVRTGYAYMQYRCDACHDLYLTQKTGVSVSDTPPAPREYPTPPTPTPIDRAAHGVKPGSYSFSTGKNGTVIETGDSRVVVPKCVPPGKALSQVQRRTAARVDGLGTLARAKSLGGKGRPW
jgi:hypothetical protein